MVSTNHYFFSEIENACQFNVLYDGHAGASEFSFGQNGSVRYHKFCDNLLVYQGDIVKNKRRATTLLAAFVMLRKNDLVVVFEECEELCNYMN